MYTKMHSTNHAILAKASCVPYQVWLMDGLGVFLQISTKTMIYKNYWQRGGVRLPSQMADWPRGNPHQFSAQSGGLMYAMVHSWPRCALLHVRLGLCAGWI
jgi:hypothetical protein